MNSITTLLTKYQELIKRQTDWLASPEGQASPEDQRLFATEKKFFYQQVVDDLEKMIDLDMIDLKFRIKSDIFPDWVYSDDHYVFSEFWKRWEGQYVDERNIKFNPIIEQEIKGAWVEVSVTCFR